jgi:PKD repeat protein
LITTKVGCKDSVIKDIVIEDSPAVLIKKVVTGRTVNFSTSDSTLFYYSWDFGDGGLSINKNPTHTYQGDGKYFVTLVVGNKKCTSTISDSVVVKSSGLPELSVYSISVYPNPTAGDLFINYTLPLPTTVKVVLTDALGKEFHVFYDLQKPGEKQIRIDRNDFHLGNGLYIIRIEIGQTSYSTKVILK